MLCVVCGSGVKDMDVPLTTTDEPQGGEVIGRMLSDLQHDRTHELFNKTDKHPLYTLVPSEKFRVGTV